LKLVIELDGGQHLEQSGYDAQRTRVLEQRGYRVLRYWNNDVLARTTDVLADVLRALESTPPQPSPAAQGREQDPALTEQASSCLSPSLAKPPALSPVFARQSALSPSLAQQGRAGEGFCPHQESQP
jgi:hypothetical protein